MPGRPLATSNGDCANKPALARRSKTVLKRASAKKCNPRAKWYAAPCRTAPQWDAAPFMIKDAVVRNNSSFLGTDNSNDEKNEYQSIGCGYRHALTSNCKGK